MGRRANKYTEINYAALKTGDVVICGGKGFLAYVIKWATTKFRNRFKKDVSCHTGTIIEFHGQKLIVEMQGNRGGINLNSLEEYAKKRTRFIMDIKRFPNMDDQDRMLIEQRAAYDLRKNLEYDFSGCVSFVIDKVKNNKKKFYCSEHTYFLLRMCNKFFTKKDMKKFDKNISPEDFNQLKNLISVNWRR